MKCGWVVVVMVDSNDIHRHSLQRKRPSWVSTVVVQVLLCVAFYVAITVWFPRARSRNTELFKRKNGISDIFVARSTDLYFLSVRGGSRPVHSQTQLLQQVCMYVCMFVCRMFLLYLFCSFLLWVGAGNGCLFD